MTVGEDIKINRFHILKGYVESVFLYESIVIKKTPWPYAMGFLGLFIIY